MLLRRPWSIRLWLATLAVAVSLPLLVVLSWVFVSEIRAERADARETALRVARANATNLRAVFDESSRLLEAIAQRPGFRAPDPTVCDPLFSIVEFFPQYLDLVLLAPDGQVRCAAKPDPDERASIERARGWLRERAVHGRLEDGKPMLVAIEGRWISMMSRRLGPDGSHLVLAELTEVVGDEALLPGSVVTIVDESGSVIVRSDQSEQWQGKDVSRAELTRLVLSRDEGRTEGVGLDGQSRQYGFTTLPETGWHLYAGIPTATLMKPARDRFVRGVAAGALVVLIVLLFAHRLSGSIERPIGDLAAAAESVGREGFGTSVPVGGPKEVASLGRAFNAMVESRAVAEARVTESERNLKALSDRLIVVQEEERRRIAREVHDDLGQLLTALKMDIGGLIKAAGPNVVPDTLRDRILRTLDQTVESVQRIAAELRPAVLDDLGLVEAIEAEGRLFEERTGIECDLSLDPVEVRLARPLESAIFRIVQEALTNVARHSEATRVEVRMRGRNDRLVVEIRDDGRGISETQSGGPASLGLIGMRERAAILGGTVEVRGIAGRGTIVSLGFPLGAASEKAS